MSGGRLRFGGPGPGLQKKTPPSGFPDRGGLRGTTLHYALRHWIFPGALSVTGTAGSAYSFFR